MTDLFSNKGSMKFFNMQFFTPTWTLVFTPASLQEAISYMNRVNDTEKEANRVLTLSELQELGKAVANVA
jgi:hypothetical protein